MTDTMRAVVLDAPGPPEALRVRELPIPNPRPGWILIRVKAFGLNRSELHTRLGLAQGVTFPRVLGIETTGVVAAAPGGDTRSASRWPPSWAAWAAPSTAATPNTPASPHPRSSLPLRPRLGDPRRRARDAPDRQRLPDPWSRRTTWSVAAHPGRHLVRRDGRRDPCKGPRTHRALDDPPGRTSSWARGDRRRPRDRRRRPHRTRSAHPIPGRRRSRTRTRRHPTLPNTLRATFTYEVGSASKASWQACEK
jgi:Alcohol dehydrogenase GroES-like domain